MEAHVARRKRAVELELVEALVVESAAAAPHASLANAPPQLFDVRVEQGHGHAFKADAPRGILDVLARGMFKDRTNAVEHAGRRPYASPLPRDVPIQIKRRGRAAIWPGAP